MLSTFYLDWGRHRLAIVPQSPWGEAEHPHTAWHNTLSIPKKWEFREYLTWHPQNNTKTTKVFNAEDDAPVKADLTGKGRIPSAFAGVWMEQKDRRAQLELRVLCLCHLGKESRMLSKDLNPLPHPAGEPLMSHLSSGLSSPALHSSPPWNPPDVLIKVKSTEHWGCTSLCWHGSRPRPLWTPAQSSASHFYVLLAKNQPLVSCQPSALELNRDKPTESTIPGMALEQTPQRTHEFRFHFQMVISFVHLLHRLFLHFPQVKNVFRMIGVHIKTFRPIKFKSRPENRQDVHRWETLHWLWSEIIKSYKIGITA